MRAFKMQEASGRVPLLFLGRLENGVMKKGLSTGEKCGKIAKKQRLEDCRHGMAGNNH